MNAIRCQVCVGKSGIQVDDPSAFWRRLDDLVEPTDPGPLRTGVIVATTKGAARDSKAAVSR
jgi:hypothetical protein